MNLFSKISILRFLIPVVCFLSFPVLAQNLPWSIIPAFTGGNKAFDIDWDYQGNIYIYGGVPPFELMKLNSAGAKQWSYPTSNFNVRFYGDFAIDRNSGTSYICEGGNNSPGAKIIKVSTSGDLIATFTGTADLTEFWRIAYNSCTNKCVIAGGNFRSFFQAAILDTNLTSLSPVNILGALEAHHDMGMLAIDDTNCYISTTQSEDFPANFDNQLIKCSLPTLLPIEFNVSNGYQFVELSSIPYASGAETCGFNGIAKSVHFLFTYDGATLKKWNPWNGIMINSISVNINPFNAGGIAVDACENVFVGSLNSVKQYDQNLTLITSFPTSSQVYDVTIGNKGELLVCGKGFVSNLGIPACAKKVNHCLQDEIQLSASDTNICNGKCVDLLAILYGKTDPYTYSWSNGISNGKGPHQVCPTTTTTYTVTAINNTIFLIDTLTINIMASTTINAGVNLTIKSGNNIQLNAHGGSHYIWKPATGLSCTNCPNPMASPLSTTTYYLTDPDSKDCATTDSIIITVQKICKEVAVPNIFTPNGDGFNDKHQIDPTIDYCFESFHITIYNRWGHLIFESTDSQYNWDGKIKNEFEAPPGNYYYVLEAEVQQLKIEKHGFIQLIR